MTLRLKIILLSLTIGIIYILPQILFTIETKGNYKIFFVSEDAESEVYTARIHEVYDGHLYISDPYIYENKSKSYAIPWLVELILGILGRVFNIPFVPFLILINSILPIALFLSLFYFLFIITKSQNLSLLGSSFILLTEFPEIITHFINSSHIELIFLSWDVTYSFMFFILCAIFTYKAILNPEISYIFLGGVSFGFLFYCHPSSWSYTIVTYILFSAYSAFKNRVVQLSSLIFIFLIGLVISVPYWVNMIRLTRLPYFPELLIRLGLFHSYELVLIKLPIIGALLFIFLYRKRDLNFYFISSFLLAGFLCINQQVISGMNYGSWRWYLYIARHISIIAGFVLLNNLLTGYKYFLEKIFKGFSYKRVKNFFSVLSFTLLILTGLYIQIYYYESSKAKQKERQCLYDAFSWLNSHTEVDSVVLAPESVSLLLPVYTHNNPYVAGQICGSVTPNSEIAERYFILARIFGMKIDEVIRSIEKYAWILFGMRPDIAEYKYYNNSSRLNVISKVLSRDYKYFDKENIFSLLGRYRLDYVFYSPQDKMLSKIDINKYPFLDKIYDKAGIQIYSIIKDYK